MNKKNKTEQQVVEASLKLLKNLEKNNFQIGVRKNIGLKIWKNIFARAKEKLLDNPGLFLEKDDSDDFRRRVSKVAARVLEYSYREELKILSRQKEEIEKKLNLYLSGDDYYYLNQKKKKIDFQFNCFNKSNDIFSAVKIFLKGYATEL